MNVIRNDIRDAVEKELAAANERFPLFASLHEAIAVIAEEKEECDDALRQGVISNLLAAWCCTRRNETKQALEHLTRMKFKAEELAIEACQVAAMCEKAIQSAERWKEKKDAE